MSTTYQPASVPEVDSKLSALTRFLRSEFASIKRAWEAAKTSEDFVVLYAAPERLRVGMVAYADGTTWNPGGGEGLYVYKSGGWTLIA